MASRISTKSTKKDALLSLDNSIVRDVIVTVQETANLEQDDNGKSKGVNVFSVGFSSTGDINLYTSYLKENSETVFYSKSAFAYSIQSLFFPNDAISGNNYITNPFTNTSVTAIHCLSFNNHLYKDKLLGFDSDLIFSITGNLSDGNLIGYANYNSANFKYTSVTQQPFQLNNFYGLDIDSSGIIPHLDELEIDYSIITARFYYSITPTFEYHKARGILLKDFGLILLFDNFSDWSGWDNIDNIYHYEQGVFEGSASAPAVYFSVNNTKISYKREQQKIQKRVDFTLPWDKANYTSNLTARNQDTAEYKFTEISFLDELTTIPKHQRPKTYISKIYLFDDELNLVAIANANKPIKKDFLTELDFKIRIEI